MLKKLDDDGISFKYQFDSICDETMIGFVHKVDEITSMENHKVSCFYAAKDKKKLYEDQVAPVALTQAEQKKVEPPKKRGAKNLFAAHDASDESDFFISHINENPHLYTWKANTCML